MQMRNRLVPPGKADTRYLRIYFPNLDSRTFSREVGECTLPPWHLLQALGTHGNAAVALQLWGPAGMGFTFTWKLGWDYHRQQYSASMDLEERFHATPISHYFPLLVIKLLYSSCSGIDCSKHREVCGWEGNHWRIEAALCHWCSLVYTGIEPL